MFWRKKKQVETRSEQDIRFLCEQDGEPERVLKQALIDDLASIASVERAYLARVEYRDPNAYEVALCLSGPESIGLVRKVSSTVREVLPQGVHLDILFLNGEQEERLQDVCRAFYRRS